MDRGNVFLLFCARWNEAGSRCHTGRPDRRLPVKTGDSNMDAPRNLMDIRREAAAKQNDLSRQLINDLIPRCRWEGFKEPFAPCRDRTCEKCNAESGAADAR